MLDEISEIIQAGGGFDLGTPEYLADFSERYRGASGSFWKLERRQVFREPDVPSWVAASSGDWPRALELIESMRAAVASEFASAPRLIRRRIRVVDFPISNYLRWELQVLRMRAEEGESTRVVDSANVASLERHRRLPELVVIGQTSLYEILYTEDGTLGGARCTTDSDVIRTIAAELAALFSGGEDFGSFSAREIGDPGR